MASVETRRADPAVPMTRGAIMHVLLQTSPDFRVLAVSADRNRLLGEMAIRYVVDKEEGLIPKFCLAVKGAHLLV